MNPNPNTIVLAASALAQTILEVVVRHNSSKGLSGPSVEEYLQALQLPASATPRFAGPPMVNIPATTTPFGGVSNGGGSGGTSSGKSSTAKKIVAPGEGCQYTFIRGEKKGSQCGAPRADGSTYCKTCMKKKSAGGTGSSSEKGGSSGGPTMPAYPTIEGGLGLAPQAPAAGNVIEAVEYQPGSGLARDLKTGFIVREDERTKAIHCLGKHDNTLNQMVPLTEADKKMARTMGLQVVEPAPAPAATVAVVAGLPLLPGPLVPVAASVAGGLPTIPALGLGMDTGAHTAPAFSGMPQIPALNFGMMMGGS